jgi:sugar lactone lactonase YvrE
MKQAEVVLPMQMTHGEGAIWDTRHHRLYWVDILEGTVFVYEPCTSQLRELSLGQMVGTIVMRRGGGAVVAAANGFAFLDLDNGKLTPIVDPDQGRAGTCFNDGKCDPAGRFWAGTLHTDGCDAADNSLYRLNTDLSVDRVLDQVAISNGIVWTSDHRTMYYIDTPTRTVSAFDYDLATGAITNRRAAIHVADDLGMPDGMAIDENDQLWVAMWGGSSVCHFDPKNDQLLDKIAVPTTNVTSCAFGGNDFDRLYITSSRLQLSGEVLAREPHAGALFVARPGVAGTASFEFAG